MKVIDGEDVPAAAQRSATGSRLNRRGRETREAVLTAAVRCLSTGRPEAVSANLIAKEAGVTWGTIQHQFGDSDGVWAAVLAEVPSWMHDVDVDALGLPRSASVAKRIQWVVDFLWASFHSDYSRAVQTLRLALPRDPDALQEQFPATAAALRRADEAWYAFVDDLLEGIVGSKVKVRRVRNLLPLAIHGIHLQGETARSAAEIEDAKRGLVDAVVAYLKA